MFKFKLVAESNLQQILTWRTSEFVTQFMKTDIAFDLNAQKNWFEQNKRDNKNCYWVIVYQDNPIGLLSINDINLSKQSCSWGFYIGEESARNLGGLIPPYFYNFVFNRTSLTHIIAEVMEHNMQVKKLHRLHGYKQVSVLKNEVSKAGEEFDLEVFSLSKTTWLQKKRFAKFIAYFELNDPALSNAEICPYDSKQA